MRQRAMRQKSELLRGQNQSILLWMMPRVQRKKSDPLLRWSCNVRTQRCQGQLHRGQGQRHLCTIHEQCHMLMLTQQLRLYLHHSWIYPLFKQCRIPVMSRVLSPRMRHLRSGRVRPSRLQMGIGRMTYRVTIIHITLKRRRPQPWLLPLISKMLKTYLKPSSLKYLRWRAECGLF